MDRITLVVPADALGYPISHGMTQYRPYLADPSDPASVSLVDVPPEVAINLMKNGGFEMAKGKSVEPELPPGMVRLRAPAEWARPSHGGFTYTPDENLCVVVPAPAVGALVESLGYKLWGDDAGDQTDALAAANAEIERLKAQLVLAIGTDGKIQPQTPIKELSADPEGTPHP